MWVGNTSGTGVPEPREYVIKSKAESQWRETGVIQQRVQYLGNGAELMYYGAIFQMRPGCESQNKPLWTQDAFKEWLKPGTSTSGISKKVKMNQSKGKRTRRADESAVSALSRDIIRVGCREVENL
jgi:hypothetical protein